MTTAMFKGLSAIVRGAYRLYRTTMIDIPILMRPRHRFEAAP